jgi:serine-type D-Ala-D-Ala carboxypeptidase (penicillin-binding protein 5/6)
MNKLTSFFHKAVSFFKNIPSFFSGLANRCKDAALQFSRMTKKARTAIICGAVATAVVLCTVIFFVWAHGYKNVLRAPLATPEQTAALSKLMDETYSSDRNAILSPLPYPVVEAKLDVKAESAILVDTSNGDILYEKNADEVIPPASMTKLFVMYIAFKEIETGHITLDDKVKLPSNCWAVNLPHDSSLMFLAQGQSVTLRELMCGLSVASGNDAAIAIADYISGDVPSFVARMNQEAANLGLTQTHFVEPSGYDEKNVTTAKEFAAFARVYINRFPQALSEFHSKRDISYPLAANLPPWQQSKGDSLSIFQKNTNPLLNTLPGCDGLKTGFIIESGYNLALTAQRGGVRFLSVTMGGPGKNSREGNETRKHDGTTLMEWAFSGFADYLLSNENVLSIPVAVPGAKRKFTRLVPAWNKTITVPHVTGKTARDAAAAVTVTVSAPPFIYGGAKAGYVYGELIFKLGDVQLDSVPLVSDRTIKRASLWGRFWGALAAHTL